MTTDVVIVSAVRTPIATAYKGSLLGVDAYQLAEVAIGAAVERSGIGNLRDGQKLSFDTERDPRKGKSSAINLKAL
jgi:hypothetical protein